MQEEILLPLRLMVGFEDSVIQSSPKSITPLSVKGELLLTLHWRGKKGRHKVLPNKYLRL